MQESDMILAKGLQFVTLASEALKRAGEEGEQEFDPTMLKVSTEIHKRGGTFVLHYRAVFGPFMVHNALPSLEDVLNALEEQMLAYGT